MRALRKLDWLVVRDFQLIETAEFWRAQAADVATEVFFFPAATHTEKDGTFTNTQRLLQWHHKAVDPPGDCRSELDFLFHLGWRLKRAYAASRDPKDRPIQDVTWDYPVEGAIAEPDAEAVLREINGYTVARRARVVEGSPSCRMTDRRPAAAGSTAALTPAASTRPRAANRTRSRAGWRRNGPGRGRRIAACSTTAPPPTPRASPGPSVRSTSGGTTRKSEWTGYDTPDFIKDRPPSFRPAEGARGTAAISGIDPFLMNLDGKAWIFVPKGLQDGPLPTHYEPQESVIRNPLYGQQCNPRRMEWKRPENRYHKAWGDPEFPYILTTYRLTEHHTAGGMTRWLSWLSELQPDMFCEVSPELAAEKGLVNGGWATITTARAEIEARVLVTERVPPLRLNGRIFHQIGVPYHWGNTGRVTGDSANELIAFVGDRIVDPRSTLKRAKSNPDGTAAIAGPRRAVPWRSACPAIKARLATFRRCGGRENNDAARRGRRRRGRLTMGKGFFTDTTVCIGCKACEVACKQWNQLPYDVIILRACRMTTAWIWEHPPGMWRFIRQWFRGRTNRWRFS